MSKSAFISYGFMEGPRHGVRMRQALQNRGYSMASSAEEADVVIAHSGGHLLLPEASQLSHVLLIDASFTTGRFALDNVMRHIVYDLIHVLGRGEIRYYTWKTLWNFVYLLREFQSARHMYTRLKNSSYSPERFIGKATIVQTDDMSWYDSRSLPLSATTRVHKDHDDCWRHPDRYLDLL